MQCLQKKRAAEGSGAQDSFPKRGTLPAIGDFISTFITTLAVLLAAGLLLAAVTGCQLLCVQSDSMVPAFSKGALLVVQPVEFTDLQEGDIITYAVSEDTLVTHRIVSMNLTSGTVTTKGDANNTKDAPVQKENIVGRVIYSAPVVGPVFAALTAGENRVYVLTGFDILAVGIFAWDALSHRGAKRAQSAETAPDREEKRLEGWDDKN